MHKSKNKPREKMVEISSESKTAKDAAALPTKELSLKAKKAQEEAEKKLAALKLKTHKITSALQWYNSLLDELNVTAATTVGDGNFDVDNEDEKKCEDIVAEKSASSSTLIKKPKHVLTPDQVIEALESCETEEVLADVETKIDILSWESSETWTIDITEQAHKWFRRHIKKDRALCERIIRRLTLLSTGRWPYVLCKALKARQIGSTGRKISLYETKIDSASRIIWEVAIAFSPRRSNVDQSYCEQLSMFP